MNKKYFVKLSEAEREQVFETINLKKTSATVRKRCNILLLADESTSKPIIHNEIANRCGVSDVTVYHTVKNYYLHGLDYALRARKHLKPPITPIVNGEQEARIVALACSSPPDGYSKWTVRLLTKRIVELEIVPAIGRETVRKTLKKLNLNLT